VRTIVGNNCFRPQRITGGAGLFASRTVPEAVSFATRASKPFSLRNCIDETRTISGSKRVVARTGSDSGKAHMRVSHSEEFATADNEESRKCRLGSQ